MKVKCLVLALGIILFGFGFGPQASAQSGAPSGQLGVGLDIGSTSLGVRVTYALNPNIQLGAQFGAGLYAGGGASAGAIVLGPYGRLLVNPIGKVTPFVEAQLVIIGGGAGYSGTVYSSSSAGLVMGGGFAFYPSQNFGVSGRLDLLQVFFSDPMVFGIGLLTPSVTAEFYF